MMSGVRAIQTFQTHRRDGAEISRNWKQGLNEPDSIYEGGDRT
jgi:hypothetical protein